MQTAVLSCGLGPIGEVSRHGMGLRVQRSLGLPVGSEVEIELSAPTDGMTVKARVVRVGAIGGGRYDVGLEFIGLTDEQMQALENLAKFGKRKPGAFGTEEERDRLVAALKLPDYYHALGLNSKAEMQEVQAAYRAMARKYHPDVCKEPGAVERFCLINDAHEVLTDADRRTEYDALYVLRRAA